MQITPTLKITPEFLRCLNYVDDNICEQQIKYLRSIIYQATGINIYNSPRAMFYFEIICEMILEANKNHGPLKYEGGCRFSVLDVMSWIDNEASFRSYMMLFIETERFQKFYELCNSHSSEYFRQPLLPIIQFLEKAKTVKNVEAKSALAKY